MSYRAYLCFKDGSQKYVCELAPEKIPGEERTGPTRQMEVGVLGGYVQASIIGVSEGLAYYREVSK